MNIETYYQADKIVRDLETLKLLQKAKDKNKWIEFNTPMDKELPMCSEVFIDDFYTFIDQERKKLEKQLEELK